MASWSNGPLTLYHGTDTRSLGTAAPSFVPNLALCRPLTDFGQGFYTTTSLHQAQEWANARARRIQRTRHGSAGALVLAFAVDRDRLAALESLVFVRPVQDFWDFVSACRTGMPPHGRSGARGPFDVVYGPVTIWPQRLLIWDCDQVSFHTPAALSILPVPTVAALASAPSGLFP